MNEDIYQKHREQIQSKIGNHGIPTGDLRFIVINGRALLQQKWRGPYGELRATVVKVEEKPVD